MINFMNAVDVMNETGFWVQLMGLHLVKFRLEMMAKQQFERSERLQF